MENRIIRNRINRELSVCYIKVWVYFNCILKKKVLVPILQVILLQTLCCCVLIVLSPETTIKKTLTLLLLDQKKIARFFSNAQWDKEFPKVGGCLGIWYEIFGWYSLSSPRGISLGLWIPLFKYDYILLYNSGHITIRVHFQVMQNQQRIIFLMNKSQIHAK